MDISYQETQDRLENRIRAHKLFGNVEIGDWLDDFLACRSTSDILDLGCGDGNHIGAYLRHVGDAGTVTGIDRDDGLIAKAAERYAGARNLSLHAGSMDDRLPFGDGVFDLCLSNFAIYNSRDADFTLRELHRVVDIGGEVVLIGPTPGNVLELYEFNEKVTGRRVDEKTLRRTERTVKEFLPLALQIFGHVRAEVINSVLTFPDRDEFLRYFCSTLLYEEIAEREGYSPEQLTAYCPANGEMTVSKEMVAIVATKPARDAAALRTGLGSF
jgi:ubiquinone/menaquinone biosynthesis C-methylase UbiE